MVRLKSVYIILSALLFFVSVSLPAQNCIKDSNFYSITCHGSDKNYITSAATVSNNEIATLFRHSEFSDYISKYTSQGKLIWSYEYTPDYPQINWWDYPTYERTLMQGMTTGLDSSFFAYGSTWEHGTTLNNAGPPTHQAGFFIHVDKYGNLLSGKYVGNWHTEYTVNALRQLSNGNIVFYMRSFAAPFTSKLVCTDINGNIVWATPLQVNDNELYKEITTVNPVMQELSNGNIMIANEMTRNVDDTIFYPFLTVIVPAPLYYFHFFAIDGKTGKLKEEYNYQCPPLKNTNVPADFVPQIRNITELSNGKVSFLGDMYLPMDQVIFFKQKVYARRVVNIITSKDGIIQERYAYDHAMILQNGNPTGNSGQQIVCARDSATNEPILLQLGADHLVEWSKTFINALPGSDFTHYAVEKGDHKGYFVFQSETSQADFHLSVTNAAGKIPCDEKMGPAINAYEFSWPWADNKFHFNVIPFDLDFRISDFKFAKKAHPVTQQIDCLYEQTCCSDIIDSLHPHNISICPNETYALPDQSLIKSSGTYYIILKTEGGCDSVVYYNVTMEKSPADLTTSPDTCISGAGTIQLRALEGYGTYYWNNVSSDQPFLQVTSPGTYTVHVENKCGSKTNTIMVFDHCDFPVYFPNAFSPNNDRKNDILRFPAQNKNKLRRLNIYNRWGQLVFSSTSASEGWDGTMKGVPQPSGQYVYYLETESFSGQISRQKGTVILVR